MRAVALRAAPRRGSPVSRRPSELELGEAGGRERTSRPVSASTISPQSGWWPTAITVSPRPATAARRSSASAPGREPLVDVGLEPGGLGDRLRPSRARAGAGSRPRRRVRARRAASPSARAASRPAGVSGRSSSGSPGRGLRRGERGSRARAQALVVLGRCAGFRYVVADVFTDTPLAGNQLAVFTDARDLDPLTMQALAKEMNFSETVFVLPPQAEDADVRIRIFTPATRAAVRRATRRSAPAFVLGGPLQKIVLRLETGGGRRAGRARARGRRDPSSAGWSSRSRRGSRSTRPDELLAAARRRAARGCRSRSTTSARRHVYVELDSAEQVAALAPDFARARARSHAAGVNCFARDGARLEDAGVLPRPRRRRGSGDRLGGRPARDPPRAPRPDRLRRGDRDLAGRRDRPALDALRARRRVAPTGSSGCGSAARRSIVARGEFRIP